MCTAALGHRIYFFSLIIQYSFGIDHSKKTNIFVLNTLSIHTSLHQSYQGKLQTFCTCFGHTCMLSLIEKNNHAKWEGMVE